MKKRTKSTPGGRAEGAPPWAPPKAGLGILFDFFIDFPCVSGGGFINHPLPVGVEGGGGFINHPLGLFYIVYLII